MNKNGKEGKSVLEVQVDLLYLLELCLGLMVCMELL